MVRSKQPQAAQNGKSGGGLMNMSAEQLARGLGWFSIGLGLAELLAPRGIARISGVKGNTTLIRLLGLREIAHGLAIFVQDKQTGKPREAVWSRVAGDALDLACLGAAFASPRTNKGRLVFATANVLTVTALDVICAQQLSSNNEGTAKGGNNQVIKSLVINRSPEELYQFWRNFENLPRIMEYLQSVHVLDDKRSHWVTKGPAGTTVEWDAEIINDEPNALIAWRSVGNATVDNAGSVRFVPGPEGRGTEVRVVLDYIPPAGQLGAVVAKLFGRDPAAQVREDLRRFKQVMETGDVASAQGT